MSDSSLPPDQPYAPIPSEAQPASKSSWRTVLIVGGIVLGILCLCVAVIAALIGRGVFAVTQEQTAITPVIQQFMSAMEQRDVDAAYKLFSSRAQRQTPIDELEALIAGANYVLFEGYQDATIENTSLTSSVNTNDNIPQGTVANVNGAISYADGVKGIFRAVLEKENGEWKLFSVNITVPPSKLQGDS